MPKACIGKAPSLHLFHTTVRHAASLRAESAPIHAVFNAVHKYYTLITMTSLQFTQAYQRHMFRLECHCQYRLMIVS